jgi:hypothetical protein
MRVLVARALFPRVLALAVVAGAFDFNLEFAFPLALFVAIFCPFEVIPTGSISLSTSTSTRIIEVFEIKQGK